SPPAGPIVPAVDGLPGATRFTSAGSIGSVDVDDVGVGSPVGHAPPQPLHGTHAKTLEPHAAAPDLRREEHDRAKHARVDRYLAVEAEPIAVEDPRTHDGLEQVLAERRPAERRETRENASPSLALEQEQGSRSMVGGEKGQ